MSNFKPKGYIGLYIKMRFTDWNNFKARRVLAEICGLEIGNFVAAVRHAYRDKNLSKYHTKFYWQIDLPQFLDL